MKLIPLFLLLVFVAGCRQQPIHRFVQVSDGGGLVLDTKSGEVCWPLPETKDRNQAIPLCSDLYKKY